MKQNPALQWTTAAQIKRLGLLDIFNNALRKEKSCLNISRYCAISGMPKLAHKRIELR